MRWVLLAIGLSACLRSTPQDEVREVAESYCRCLAQSDSKCVDELVSSLGTSVPLQCSDCVFEHERTCASMIEVCTPLCSRQQGGGP